MGEISPSSDADGGAGVSALAARKRRSVIALGVAALVAIGAIVVTVTLVSGPRPDATLLPSGVAPDNQLITMMEREGTELDLSNPAGFGSEMVIDLRTLRGFGTYRDFELWSATNAFQSPCLIAVHRATVDIVARACVPAEAELFIDTYEHGLPAGESLRFFLRDDTVDAYHLAPEEVE